jgi:hypothetical protein
MPTWSQNLRSKKPTSTPIVINRGYIAESGVIPNGLQLLQDTSAWKVIDQKTTIREGTDLQGKKFAEPVMVVRGLFQICDEINANDRIYPLSIMRSAVDAIQEDIRERAVIGELDHPVSAKVNLDRISHGITKVWMDGKKVYGEAEIIDNQPYGRCLRGLFEGRWRIGISSRSVGDMELIESSGRQIHRVLDGLSIVTWDAVQSPSVKKAILKPIHESMAKVERKITESITGKSRPTANGKFFSKADYTNMILDELNRSLGLRDFGPRQR